MFTPKKEERLLWVQVPSFAAETDLLFGAFTADVDRLGFGVNIDGSIDVYQPDFAVEYWARGSS